MEDTYKFIPTFITKNPRDSEIADSFEIFHNHCRPLRGNIEVYVEAETEEITIKTIGNFEITEIPELIMDSTGVDDKVRRLVSINYNVRTLREDNSGGFRLELDNLAYLVIFTKRKLK